VTYSIQTWSDASLGYYHIIKIPIHRRHIPKTIWKQNLGNAIFYAPLRMTIFPLMRLDVLFIYISLHSVLLAFTLVTSCPLFLHSYYENPFHRIWTCVAIYILMCIICCVEYQRCCSNQLRYYCILYWFSQFRSQAVLLLLNYHLQLQLKFERRLELDLESQLNLE